MTREEAISWLVSLTEHEGEDIPIYDTDVEALNMAIKALEQEPTTKNDLGVDCISRAQVQTEIEMNASRYTIAKERGGMGQVEWSDQLIKVSDAVDIIRNLPPITPQEPFINKACVSSKVCEHDKEVVLDKIRAEIMEYIDDLDIATEICDIFDKYKAESEE